MASQDDSLKIAAEIVDKFSGPLKDMQRSLRALSGTATIAHKEGARHAKEHEHRIGELRKEFIESGRQVRELFVPALASIGIAGFSAAEGIKKIAESIVDFGQSARSLTYLSRQTGLTVDQLRELEALAPRIGSSANEMSRGLGAFAEHMEKLRRMAQLPGGIGIAEQAHEIAQAMGVAGPRARQFEFDVQRLMRNMQGRGRFEQLEQIEQFLDRIQDFSQKRAFLRAFGLDENLANAKNFQDFKAQIEDIHKRLGEMTDEERQRGLRAAEGFDHLRESLDKLKESVGAGLADQMAQITNGMADFVSQHGKDIAEFFEDVAKWIKEADWSGFAKDVREAATGINTAAEAMGGWKTVIEGLIVLRLSGWLFGILTPLRALAGLTAPSWLLGLPALAAAAAALRKEFGEPAEKKQLEDFDKLHPGRKLEDMPGLTDEQRKNLKDLYGGRGRLTTPPAPLPTSPLPPSGFSPNGEGFELPGIQRERFLEPERSAGISLIRASYQPGAGIAQGSIDQRLEGAVERGSRRGIYDGLWDFLRGQPEKGGAAGGVAAVKAAYSPGGGVEGTGTGTGGGAAGAGGSANAPAGGAAPRGFPSLPGMRGFRVPGFGGAGGIQLPRMPGLGGGSTPASGGTGGGAGTTRQWDIPSIPAGAGGDVADRLKGAGINLPPELEAKIRKGQPITGDDLKGLPQGDLDKAGQMLGKPLYHDVSRPGPGGGDATAFDKMFAGTALQGHWPDIAAAAEKYGADPTLMGAIMAQETGRGQHITGNNVAGLMRGMNKERFASLQEGIDVAGQRIARNWQRGGGTLEGMRDVYAPLGAANDPRGLNKNWLPGVRKFRDELAAKPAAPAGGNIFHRYESHLGGADEAPVTGDVRPGAPIAPGAVTAVGGVPPQAFIMHHTSGRGSIEGLRETLRQRGLGVEYGMDREGNISQIGGPGAANIMRGWGPKGQGLSNRNIVGMEVIARNNRDVTEKQIRSAQEFIRKNYPNTPVFGHGEVNPGHKEADEGMAIVGAIRKERAERLMADKHAPGPAAGLGLHGHDLRRHFGHPQQRAEFPNLLGDARRAGLLAPQKHQVEGNASVSVDFKNMPRGVTPSAKASGLFTEVRMNRGRAMPLANQEG